MNWEGFGAAAVTLTVIIDPLGNVPVFLALTGGHERKQRVRAAYVATLVAASVILSFALFGELLLDYLSVSLESLMVAGGLLLATVSCLAQFASGPGAIVATMVLMRQHSDAGGWTGVILGVLAALATNLLALRFASWFGRALRPSAIAFLTRIMGLLLTAIAVQLVVTAIARWQEAGLR